MGAHAAASPLHTLSPHTLSQPYPLSSYFLQHTYTPSLHTLLQGYHIKESPINLVAGSGFFSDHLAQHKEPPSAPGNVDLLTERHARGLRGAAADLEAGGQGRKVDSASGASTMPTSASTPMEASHQYQHPHTAGECDDFGGVLGERHFSLLGSPFSRSARPPRSSERARQADYAAAQIREVRKRAVARGLLLGAEPPLKPPLSPQKAFEAATQAASDERAVAASELDLPPRALWERQRAKAAAAAVAAEAGRSRSGSDHSGQTAATPVRRAVGTPIGRQSGSEIVPRSDRGSELRERVFARLPGGASPVLGPLRSPTKWGATPQ